MHGKLPTAIFLVFVGICWHLRTSFGIPWHVCKNMNTMVLDSEEQTQRKVPLKVLQKMTGSIKPQTKVKHESKITSYFAKKRLSNQSFNVLRWRQICPLKLNVFTLNALISTKKVSMFKLVIKVCFDNHFGLIYTIFLSLGSMKSINFDYACCHSCSQKNVGNKFLIADNHM